MCLNRIRNEIILSVVSALLGVFLSYFVQDSDISISLNIKKPVEIIEKTALNCSSNQSIESPS